MIYETYWSRRRLVPNPMPTKTLSEKIVPLVSFASLLFTTLSLFICVVLVHKNLAPIETSFRSLASVPHGMPFLLESRVHALSAIVRPVDKNSYELIFSNDKRFILPAQQNALQNMLNQKATELVETAVLTLSETPGSSRVQLWPEKDLSPYQLDSLVSLFTAAGFDDFDIAVSEQGAATSL